MKIAVASDHGGFHLKEELTTLLHDLGYSFEDFGCYNCDSVDYPDYALVVANKVAAGEFDRGILVCGTGIGMSIAANKIKGIRCALAHDTFSARLTRQHNDSNVLALGERVIGPGLAKDIVSIWLQTEFEGERHARRIQKITEAEK